MIEAISFNEVLAGDDKIGRWACAPPHAFVLPYKKSNVEKYLIIWLYLENSMATLDRLWMVITRAILLANQDASISKLRGVEVVPCVGNPGNGADRILRISVYQERVQSLLELDSSALLVNEPVIGATCGWYWSTERLTQKLS